MKLFLLPPLHIGPRLASWMSVSLAYSLVVTWIVIHFSPTLGWYAGKELAALLGVGLGVLIVFRNNAAHDRWWEARKLWGQLINELRNLALKAQAHAEVDAEEHARFAKYLVDFAHSLRLHLRGWGRPKTEKGNQTVPEAFPHAPGYVAWMVHETLNQWNRQGKLKDTIWIMDHHARALMDICGACERIKNTPLASSYRALFRLGILLYVLFAPWALALDLGWWCLPALAVGFGFIIGIELTAEEVEEPFGTEKDDLPLESYCQTIEQFVTAVLKYSPKDIEEVERQIKVATESGIH